MNDLSDQLDALLPTLSDQELAEISAALDRISDAHHVLELLSHELSGTIALLENAHR